MNSTELMERLNKAEANVEKIKKTIERHEKQAEKKLKVITDNGWKIDRWAYNDGSHDDAYWAICEYENKLSDIKGAQKKLAEAEQIVDNWKCKFDKQLAAETKIQTEIPEVFKKAKDDLVELWTSWDINARDTMVQKKQEMLQQYSNYREFKEAWYKLYSYSKEESLRKTDEEFRKINEKDAEAWLLDLYNRVYEITGEITDCAGIQWGGKCLDGYVVGQKGKASVETIGAGGYNIQKWHLRTLVKKMK